MVTDSVFPPVPHLPFAELLVECIDALEPDPRSAVPGCLMVRSSVPLAYPHVILGKLSGFPTGVRLPRCLPPSSGWC